MTSYPATPKGVPDQMAEQLDLEKYSQVPHAILEEKETLGVLNTRLKNVFYLAQKEHADRKTKVKQARDNMDEVEREDHDVKRKLKDARDSWRTERYKQSQLRVRTIQLKNEESQKNELLNAFGESENSHVAALRAMIKEKTDKLREVEAELNKLREDSNNQNHIIEEMKARIGKDLTKFEALLAELIRLEVDIDTKAFDLVLKETLHAQHRNKLERYAGKGINEYYQELYAQQFSQGVASLDAKYEKLLEQRKNMLEEEFKERYDKAIERHRKHQSYQDQIKEEFAKMNNQIKEFTKEIKELERENEKLQDKIAKKEEEKKAKEKDIQSLVAMITNEEQSQATLKQKLGAIKDHVNASAHKVNQLKKGLTEKRAHPEKELHDLDAQINLIKQKFKSVATQLEESNIFLNSEIKKYEVLVEVAEAQQSPGVKRRRLNPIVEAV